MLIFQHNDNADKIGSSGGFVVLILWRCAALGIGASFADGGSALMLLMYLR
jgi:hypothetical protein